MGEKRKGGNRGRPVRARARNGDKPRGAQKNTRPRGHSRSTGHAGLFGRRNPGAEVVSLSEGRARRGRRGRRRAPGLTRGVPDGDAAKGGAERGAKRGAKRAVGRGRLRVVAAVFAMTGLLLGGRAVHMVATDDARYGLFAAEQEGIANVASVTEPRGSVGSADGRELATSLRAARVVATPYQIEEPEAAARALAGVLDAETGQSAAEIEALLTKRDASGGLGGYSVVASGVKPEVAEEVEALAIPGITTTPDAVRLYPEGDLASQLTGHLGDYGEAFGGVEASYDEVLKGGEDVTLTVDTAVQEKLEEELAATVEKYQAKSGVGVIMRIDDGAIVALANAPSYDNNRFGAAPVEDQRDRVLDYPYEPGSTFKAFTVASAIEAGAVSEDSVFAIPDKIRVADRVVHDSHPHPTMALNPAGILAASSNVGAIQVAESLGAKKLYDSIVRFGFGEPTGVDLLGEQPGVVPPYKDWSGSSIGNIPIGQGLTVTPLQMVAGYAAIANGGTSVTPHVVQQDDRPLTGKRLISRETSDIVKGMLQGVVDQPGYNAQIPGYSVAGKTGTSQKLDPKTGAYTTEYIASFIGFAPVSDPEYVALIAVDEPQKTMWGEVASAPVFAEVMGFTLGYFNVPPDRPPSEPAPAEASGEGSKP